MAIESPIIAAFITTATVWSGICITTCFLTLLSLCAQVVMLAQEEARRLGHNFVGTEQLLLGLIGESTGALEKLEQGFDDSR